MQIDSGTATIVAAAIGAAGVAMASVAATVASGKKTRTAIEIGLGQFSQKLEDHIASDRREFDELGKRVGEVIKETSDKFIQHAAADRREFDTLTNRIAACDQENDQQWASINRHTAEIGYLQGKANGKAAGK